MPAARTSTASGPVGSGCSASSGTAPCSRRMAARMAAMVRGAIRPPPPCPTISRPHGRRRHRLRRAGSRAVRDPGLELGRGAHARVHERRGAGAHARHRRAAPLEPLARRAVAQGRDVRPHPGGCARSATTATATRSSRSWSRPAPPATRASGPASTAASSSRRPRTRSCPAWSGRSPRAPRRRPRAPTPRSCSPTRRSRARRWRRRPRRSPAPCARRATSGSPRRPRTCSTTWPRWSTPAI